MSVFTHDVLRFSSSGGKITRGEIFIELILEKINILPDFSLNFFVVGIRSMRK